MRGKIEKNCIRILCFFSIIKLYLFSGFYEYVVCLTGIFFELYFVINMIKEVKTGLHISYSSLALISVALYYDGCVLYA